jgi:hypothetical protein
VARPFSSHITANGAPAAGVRRTTGIIRLRAASSPSPHARQDRRSHHDVFQEYTIFREMRPIAHYANVRRLFPRSSPESDGRSRRRKGRCGHGWRRGRSWRRWWATADSAQEAHDAETALTITAHLADYANLSHSALADARERATEAFRAAGFDLVWSSVKGSPDAESLPRSSSWIEVRVLILSREMAEAKIQADAAMSRIAFSPVARINVSKSSLYRGTP